jgi:hypothetical protein
VNSSIWLIRATGLQRPAAPKPALRPVVLAYPVAYPSRRTKRCRLPARPLRGDPDAKRERISRRARPRTQRLTPMPTPSSLPQRSRITLLSRRSSGPSRRSPLHMGHSPAPLITPFRINTCKSVTKQTTLITFRINTYAKTGEGGPHPVCSVPPWQVPPSEPCPARCRASCTYPHLPTTHLHPPPLLIALGDPQAVCGFPFAQSRVIVLTSKGDLNVSE